MLDQRIVGKHTAICLYLDYYGSLLTARRQEILHMSYEDDMSLSEIAASLNITRQAVHDNIRQAVDQLEGYEAKLGMVKRDRKILDQLNSILEGNPDLAMSQVGYALRDLQKQIL